MDHYFTNNQNLKSEIKNINYSYNGKNYSFFSDNGVFSKDKIDYGSKLLIETFLKNNPSKGKYLDIGCGYGFIGLILASELDIPITMVDVNKRALHLAKMNADALGVRANIYESNCYSNVEDKFDVIITNPPVRAGKKILLEILEGAFEHLNAGGTLWYVLRKDQGAESIKKLLNKYFDIEVMEKSKGFHIFKCKSIDTKGVNEL